MLHMLANANLFKSFITICSVYLRQTLQTPTIKSQTKKDAGNVLCQWSVEKYQEVN